MVLERRLVASSLERPSWVQDNSNTGYFSSDKLYNLVNAAIMFASSCFCWLAVNSSDVRTRTVPITACVPAFMKVPSYVAI